MRLSVFGMPSSAGANMTGSEAAPFHLRLCGLNYQLLSRGAEVIDYGDCDLHLYTPDPDNRSPKNLPGTVQAAQQVLEKAKRIFLQGDRVLLLGGDCTVTIGLVAAALETNPDLGLAYLDSAPDLNTPDRSDEGILDSMGMAHLLGFVDNELSRLTGWFPLLDPERICAFGFHPDRAQEVEHEFLNEHPIDRYPGTEVSGNIARKASEACRKLEAKCEKFIIHFDVDVIDYSHFPVADFPVYRGFGLTFDDAMEALRIFFSSHKCIAACFTEFNPDRDKQGAYGRRYVAALAEALVPDPAK